MIAIGGAPDRGRRFFAVTSVRRVETLCKQNVKNASSADGFRKKNLHFRVNRYIIIIKGILKQITVSQRKLPENRQIFPKGADAVMIFKRISRAVRARLMSERGASIFFALLTLLVCITVGSVVLTAGTAASGRLAETAENDQRYYSVSSAAELIKSMVDGQKVTFVKQKERLTTTVSTYQYDENLPISEDDPSTAADESNPTTPTTVPTPETPVYTAEYNVPDADSPAQFCYQRALKLIFGVSSVPAEKTIAETAYTHSGTALTEKETVEYTMKVDGQDTLDVSAVCTMSPNGSLVFRLTSADGKHTEYLTFSANISDSGEKATDTKVENTVITHSGINYTETSEVTETWQKTVTVKWTFDGITEDSPA